MLHLLPCGPRALCRAFHPARPHLAPCPAARRGRVALARYRRAQLPAAQSRVVEGHLGLMERRRDPAIRWESLGRANWERKIPRSSRSSKLPRCGLWSGWNDERGEGRWRVRGVGCGCGRVGVGGFREREGGLGMGRMGRTCLAQSECGRQSVKQARRVDYESEKAKNPFLGRPASQPVRFVPSPSPREGPRPPSCEREGGWPANRLRRRANRTAGPRSNPQPERVGLDSERLSHHRVARALSRCCCCCFFFFFFFLFPPLSFTPFAPLLLLPFPFSLLPSPFCLLSPRLPHIRVHSSVRPCAPSSAFLSPSP